MRFGLGPLTIEPAGGKNHVDVYEEALEQAVIAEWWGFDSVWVGEHNFTPDSFNSSSSVIAAAVAQRTTFVRVGMMPTLGLVNAMYVAEEAACVDNISNGRVIVAGQVASDAVARGWGGQNSVERIVDDVAVLRASWGPNPFSHHSDFHTIPGEIDVHVQARGLDRISVQPKPAQLEMPLWISGGATAAQVARELNVPFFAPAHFTLDELRPFYAGRDSSDNGQIVPIARDVFIAPTTEQAYELAGPAIAELYASLSRAGVLDHNEDFDKLVAGRFIIGDPDVCITSLYEYQNELNANYVVARLAYHAMHAGETSKAIQLFGQAVVPEFRMFGLPEEIRRVV